MSKTDSESGSTDCTGERVSKARPEFEQRKIGGVESKSVSETAAAENDDIGTKGNYEERTGAGGSKLMDSATEGEHERKRMEDSDRVSSIRFKSDPANREFDAEWTNALSGRSLRYFAPAELLRIFGFNPPRRRVHVGKSTSSTSTTNSSSSCRDDIHVNQINDHDLQGELMTALGGADRSVGGPDSASCSASVAPIAQVVSDTPIAWMESDESEVRRRPTQGVTNPASTSLAGATAGATIAGDVFTFPSSLSDRKCYELIGNSLNVTVVTHLLHFLFTRSVVLPDHGIEAIEHRLGEKKV